MFQKPLALKLAGLLGVVAGFFYILFSIDFSTQLGSIDPYAEKDWMSVIEQTAQDAGPTILTHTLAFIAAVLLIFYLVALAARAQKNHPSLAGLGGIFLVASAGMLALRSIWIAFVQIPMAITYHGVTDQAYRQLLLNHFRLDLYTNLFFAWGYIFFVAVGLLLMGLALTPVKDFLRLLPITFLLAGVACAAFVPAVAYVGNQIFMRHQFNSALASRFFFAAWFLPGLAFLASGAWLIREASRQEMPQEEIQDIHLERAA